MGLVGKGKLTLIVLESLNLVGSELVSVLGGFFISLGGISFGRGLRALVLVGRRARGLFLYG